MSVRKLSTNSILSPTFKNSRVWDRLSYPSYFDSIASVTAPGGSGTTVTFSNIPQNYSSLRLHINAAPAGTSVVALQVAFNSDIGSNYSAHGFFQANGGMIYNNATNLNYSTIFAGSYGFGGGSGSLYWSNYILDIYDYSSASKNKTLSGFGGWGGDGTNGAFGFGSSLWRSQNPINSLEISTTYSAGFRYGSTFCLYGMK